MCESVNFSHSELLERSQLVSQEIISILLQMHARSALWEVFVSVDNFRARNVLPERFPIGKVFLFARIVHLDPLLAWKDQQHVQNVHQGYIVHLLAW